MVCPFCGTGGEGNRCYKCGMNKDAFIPPIVFVPEPEVEPEPAETPAED